MSQRQLFLDTETTGLRPEDGNRIVEIGVVEAIDGILTGNNLHFYFNPERDSEPGALIVHGLTREFLTKQPLFADKAADILTFINGAELLMHNADFDMKFLNMEMSLAGQPMLAETSVIRDTLEVARSLRSGKRNSLDALCKEYKVDASDREKHGALIDATLLANVFLEMTKGVPQVFITSQSELAPNFPFTRLTREAGKLRIVQLSPDDLQRHETSLGGLAEKSGKSPVWNADLSNSAQSRPVM